MNEAPQKVAEGGDRPHLLEALARRFFGQEGSLRGRRAKIAAYVVPAVLAAAIVQSWFEPGAFVASGDNPPFIRDSVVAEARSLWGHDAGGNGGPGTSILLVPDAALIGASRFLGIPPEGAQRIFLTLTFAGAAASLVFFGFTFLRRPAAAAMVGVLGIFNFYIMQNDTTVDFWQIIVLCLTGGLLFRAARGDPISPIWLVLTSMLFVYVAVNPPRLAVTLLWLIACVAIASAVQGPGGTRRAAAYLMRAAPGSLLINLWWLLPMAFSLISPTGRTFVAPTNVQQWAFTQARSSISNVLTLGSNWGWAFPENNPYAPSLGHAWWKPLSFILPCLALSAPLVVRRDRRNPVLVFTGLALILVALNKGIHPPLGALNQALYDHVPGMWLLREPVNKIGPILLVCYSMLGAVTLSALSTRWHRQTAPRLGLRAVPALLLAGAVLFPWPLWNGAVRADVSGLHSSHAWIPDAWYQVASTINASPTTGKALLLPLDDYYQVPTKWGYYGVDAIPRLLLKRPTIQNSPGGYFEPDSTFASLVQSVQTALLAGDVRAVPPLLTAMGVTFVILRTDIVTDAPRRRLIPAAHLRGGLNSVPGLHLVQHSSVADLYAFGSRDQGMIQTYSSILNAAPRQSLSFTPSPLGSLDPGEVATTKGGLGDGILRSFALRRRSQTFPLSEGNLYQVTRRLYGSQPYIARIMQAGEGATLSFEPATRLVLDGTVVTDPSLDARLPSAPASVQVDGRVVPIGDATQIALRPGSTAVALSDSGPVATLGFSPQRVGDCDRYDDRSIAQLGITATPIRGITPGIRLSAREHSACVQSPPISVTPGDAYRLHLRYRTIEGSSARVCLLEAGGQCLPIHTEEASSSWRPLDTTFVASPGVTSLKLFVYADQPLGTKRTTTEYSGPTLTTLQPLGDIVVPSAASNVVTRSLSAGSHEIMVESRIHPFMRPLSDVGDCNRYDNRTPEQVGLRADALPDELQPAIRLRARDHSACVSAAITPVLPGVPYNLTFDTRNLEGPSPRICLVEGDLGGCANATQPTPGAGWHRFEESIQPDRGTASLRLFLYADAAGTKRGAVTEFRNIRVTLAPPYRVVLRPTQARLKFPSIAWTRTGPNAYEGLVPASDRPLVLGFAETMDSGWLLQGVAPNRSVRHIRINGYENGWLIGPGREVHFTLAFGPDHWLKWANVLSGLTALSTLVLLIRRPRRWRKVGAENAGTGAPSSDE